MAEWRMPSMPEAPRLHRTRGVRPQKVVTSRTCGNTKGRPRQSEGELEGEHRAHAAAGGLGRRSQEAAGGSEGYKTARRA
eukprot:3550770-Prymnesium_polylepis.1